MPDFWTHILAGEHMVKAGTNKDMINIMEENRTSFNFGCQGSDVFFYNISTPWRGPALGKKMHYDSVNEAFFHAVSYGKKNYCPRALSFLMGYLSHIVTDRYLHPFILARSPNFTIHKEIENELDSFLLEHFRGEKARNINPFFKVDFSGDVKQSGNIPHEINGFFESHLHEIYDYSEGLKTLRISYRDFKYLQSTLYSPGPVKRTALRAANAVIPYDIDTLLYEAGNEILWPEERSRFLYVYRAAKERGADILSDVFLYWQNEIDMITFKNRLEGEDFSGADKEEILSTLPESAM